MVVEDDAAMRKFAVMLLNDLGYRTFDAEDGPAALDLLKAGARIDLLLTDVVLRKAISGPALAKAAEQLVPGLKILYMSGYTRDAMLHNGALEEGVHLIMKPFRKRDLAAKIRSILGAPV
jgi:CheY-like chemotaxis protein